MDRFKFRVWNIKNKNFIYDAIYAYDGNNYSGKDNDGWIYCFGEYIDRNNEYIVEQCTGLKDKNGNLIYEGDILQFKNNGAIYIIKYKPYDSCAFCCCAEKYCITLDNDFASDIEIIGNIHENPELLEE